MKTIFNSIFLVSLLFVLQSCSLTKSVVVTEPQTLDIRLDLLNEGQPNKFVDLDYGIRLNVKDSRSKSNILNIYDASVTSVPKTTLYPDLEPFVSESMRRYMRTMGFDLDADISTDYYLSVKIREYNISYLSGIGWSGLVQISLEVFDNNNKQVYPNVTAVGRYSINGSSKNSQLASKALNEAFVKAMEDIDWERIAYFLKRSDNPALEQNKKVVGDGNTALENTIIRWFIESSPRGADVYTRVVSSTSDVKNTNQNYVGTTPYETTESFDIKGLTFNNSGNVQIEVICEKSGYITQKKRFNLRQAIEQKEISTKFNLIKEE
ncbi:MAG: hypothetical protein E7079_00985 [Bacteroidales bacterium]|nr:hypothetical protein [Bacteroidales bacterium]